MNGLGEFSFLLLTHTLCVFFGMTVRWIVDKALPAEDE